jgi:putative ABC transport system permease protein
MWLVGFRDLQWRRRRFVIGVLATALVFSITLVLAGVAAFFENETRRTVRSLGVDAWVVPRGVTGPFTSTAFMTVSQALVVASDPGVRQAAPLLMFHETVRVPSVRDLNVIGVTLGAVGVPSIASGRLPSRSGEIVVDGSLGERIGDGFGVGKRMFRVVGRTHGLTFFAGTPVAFMSLGDAQQVLFAGQPLATTIVTRGVPRRLPAGLVVRTNEEVRADLRRPIDVASRTIRFIDVLLWAIAAAIIGAILYMSALERVKDFAVLKATGASNRFVGLGLASQAIVLSVSAAIAAAVISLLLAPMFPIPVEIPARSYLVLFTVGVVVGLLGSVAGLRRALAVDPALAFGG